MTLPLSVRFNCYKLWMRMRQRKRNVFLPVDHHSSLLLRRMRQHIRRKRLRKRQLPVDHPASLLLRRIWQQRMLLMISQSILCNQTLAAILTHQLCREMEPDREKMAIDLENSVIVMSPLVPWSIAGAVPLATVGAPLSSLAAAFYLYFLPIWTFGAEYLKKKKMRPKS